MKQILLMIAVVAVVGCGKKPVAASVLEQARRESGHRTRMMEVKPHSHTSIELGFDELGIARSLARVF